MPEDNDQPDTIPQSNPIPETSSAPEAPLTPGFYVFLAGSVNSGPYLTETDAQAFISGQLSGEGEVISIA